MPRFPSGDAAYQQRYIEAFRGLTQMLVAKIGILATGNDTPIKKWQEMFDALIAEEAQQEEADPLE